MTPINKLELLNKLESKIELHLKETIEVFQNLDEAVLLEPSVNGGWSIAQCLAHLNSYGHYYLPLIKSGLENGKDERSADYFKSTWLGDYFTRLMEPKAGMKKMKTFKNHIPSEIPDAHAVIAEFIQQQEGLLKLLKVAERKNLNSIKIPISISKLVRLRLGDVLQFIVAHNERHLQQARRNL